MAKAGNKTAPTPVPVAAFLAGVEPEARRAEARELFKLYAEVTGLPARMWGPSIVGFGSYHYKYASGREGDMCRAGFSPRKDRLTLYLMGGYADPGTGARLAALRAKLGRHKTGKSCLYIGKLADVDLGVLREMIATDLAGMNRRFPGR